MKIKGQRTLTDWIDAEAEKIARRLFIDNLDPKGQKAELEYQRMRLHIPLQYEDLFYSRVAVWYREISIAIEGVDPDEDEEVQP